MIWKTISKQLWFVFTIAMLSMTLGFVRSQTEQARFAYLIDVVGEYLKVDLTTTQVVEHGSLKKIKALQPDMPYGREAIPASLVRYDPTHHRLYVLAVEGPGHNVGVGQATRFWVLVLELPTFKLIGRMDLMEGDFSPNMLLTPDGERLLMSYKVTSYEPGSKNFIFFREVYDTQRFKRLDQKRYEVPREPYDPKALAKARFSNKARFAADGKTIVDEGYEVIDSQVRVYQSAPLPKEVLEYLKTHPHFSIEELDEVGRRILLPERKPDQQHPGYHEDYYTGRFALYDALPRPNIREFYLEALAGQYPKIFGIWPDGRGFFFAKGSEELYAVKVDNDIKPIRLPLHGLQPRLSECIFADR